MINQKILCRECNKQITSKKDLITAMHFIFLRPYHANCYARNIRGIKTMFLGNYPINGFSGTVSAVIGGLIGLFFLRFFSLVVIGTFFAEGFTIFYSLFFTLVAIVFLTFIFLPLFLRLYSYFHFERKFSY